MNDKNLLDAKIALLSKDDVIYCINDKLFNHYDKSCIIDFKNKVAFINFLQNGNTEVRSADLFMETILEIHDNYIITRYNNLYIKVKKEVICMRNNHLFYIWDNDYIISSFVKNDIC